MTTCFTISTAEVRPTTASHNPSEHGVTYCHSTFTHTLSRVLGVSQQPLESWTAWNAMTSRESVSMSWGFKKKKKKRPRSYTPRRLHKMVARVGSPRQWCLYLHNKLFTLSSKRKLFLVPEIAGVRYYNGRMLVIRHTFVFRCWMAILFFVSLRPLFARAFSAFYFGYLPTLLTPASDTTTQHTEPCFGNHIFHRQTGTSKRYWWNSSPRHRCSRRVSASWFAWKRNCISIELLFWNPETPRSKRQTLR